MKITVEEEVIKNAAQELDRRADLIRGQDDLIKQLAAALTAATGGTKFVGSPGVQEAIRSALANPSKPGPGNVGLTRTTEMNLAAVAKKDQVAKARSKSVRDQLKEDPNATRAGITKRRADLGLPPV